MTRCVAMLGEFFMCDISEFMCGFTPDTCDILNLRAVFEKCVRI